MRRAALLCLALAIFTVHFTGAGSAEPRGPGSFTLHLECEGGAEFEILVPVGASFAALVDDSNSVAVLKGQDFDFDGIPEILVPGFSTEDLTACTTLLEDEEGELIPIFVAYVLFTPAR
jgi:hypothetical protein